jgi:hypothetical protein
MEIGWKVVDCIHGTGCCEHGEERLDSIKGREFLE